MADRKDELIYELLVLVIGRMLMIVQWVGRLMQELLDQERSIEFGVASEEFEHETRHKLDELCASIFDQDSDEQDSE